MKELLTAIAGNPLELRVTNDGHDSYLRAIREVLGPNLQHTYEWLRD